MSHILESLMVRQPPKVLHPEDIELKHRLKATWRIWHEKHVVIVPNYAARRPEYVALHGTTYTTGLTDQQKDLVNKEPTTVRLTIDRQIQLYDEGISIGYPNRMDAVKIYMDVKQHLENWSALIGGSLNIVEGAPDLADFELMLEFAENLECYLEFYYQTQQSHRFGAFKRSTMNKFARDERHAMAQGSTYNRIREGVFGFQSDRRERVDSLHTTHSFVREESSEHRMPEPDISDMNEEAIMNNIRGG